MRAKASNRIGAAASRPVRPGEGELSGRPTQTATVEPRSKPIASASRKPYEVPVFLHHHGQPYYTRLQRAVIDTLSRECARHYEAHRQQDHGAAVADDALIAANRRTMQSGRRRENS